VSPPNSSAEHVANSPLDPIFSHQLELRVGLFFPNRDFRKSYSDSAIAKRILARLVDVVQITPGYIHGALIVEKRYSSRGPFAVRLHYHR
jgi:hypothetical protein